MDQDVPEAVAKCTNDTLRMAAIAAIHRGTEVDMNKTLHDCIQFNKNKEREDRNSKLIQDREAWTKWFSASSLIS